MLSAAESRELDGIRQGLDACLRHLAQAELAWIGGGPSGLAAVADAHRRFADASPYRWVASIDAPPVELLPIRRALGRTALALATAGSIDELRRAASLARTDVDGTPMTAVDAVREIRWERDTARRRRLAAALDDCRREVAGMEGRALGAAWDAAREMGHDGLLAAMVSWHGPELGELPARAEAFLRSSAELARELVVEGARRGFGLAPAELRWEDVAHHLQGGAHRAELPDAFLPTMVANLLERSGFPRSILARIRLAPRAERRPLLGAASIPVSSQEIVVAIDPCGGVRQHGVHLREVGRALGFAACDEGMPVERRRSPDEVASRALGLLLETLLGNPVFLRRVAKVGHPRDFARLPRAATLARARRQAAQTILHRELEARGSLEGASDLHHELARKALQAAPPRVPDLTSPEEPALWLAALPWALALADHLRERFDEDWFLNPRTGPYLLSLFGSEEGMDAARLAAELGPAPHGDDLSRRLEREEGA